MQPNGQGLQNSPARWSTRLRRSLSYGNQLRKHPPAGYSIDKAAADKSSLAATADGLPIPIKPRPVFETGGPFFHRESLVLLAGVLLAHAVILYLLTRIIDIQMPAVSVPLQISFALNEPVHKQPKVKPRYKPQALADEPVPAEKPAEEPRSQVIPPEYKVTHLNNPAPEYPALSRRLREQGDVVLRVYVTAEGTPGEIQLHTSSGFPRLDRATHEAVERWRFIPARRGEDPVGAWVLVTINWVLN